MLVGRRAGNYIVAYPCVEVINLSWVDESEDKCYDGLPVEFGVNGSKLNGSEGIHKGFLLPKYNKIEVRGIEVNCHNKQPIITGVGGNLEWHSVHSKKIHIINVSNVIDLTDQMKEGIGVIDFMQTDWVYDAEDLRDTEIDRLVKEENSVNHDKEIAESKEGEVSSLWEFLGIFNGKMSTIFNAAIMWIERVAIGILLWKVFKISWSCRRIVRRLRGERAREVVNDAPPNYEEVRRRGRELREM